MGRPSREGLENHGDDGTMMMGRKSHDEIMMMTMISDYDDSSVVEEKWRTKCSGVKKLEAATSTC